jgi:hypothetical protein
MPEAEDEFEVRGRLRLKNENDCSMYEIEKICSSLARYSFLVIVPQSSSVSAGSKGIRRRPTLIARSSRTGGGAKEKAGRYHQKLTCFRARPMGSREFRTITLDAIVHVAFLKRSHQTSPTLFSPGVEY